MAKKSNPIGLSLTTEVGGINSLVGEIVSINLKADPYFGIGSMWLTPTRYWAKIPADLLPEEYEILRKSLESGKIVKGKVFIPPVDKPSGVIDEYWDLIARQGISQEFKEKIQKTFVKNNGLDRHYTLLEIRLECKRREEKGKHRHDVVRWLTEISNEIGGPVRVYDPPDDDEGVKKIVIGTDGSISAENAKGEPFMHHKHQSNTPPRPGNIKVGDMTTAQALGTLLE